MWSTRSRPFGETRFHGAWAGTRRTPGRTRRIRRPLVDRDIHIRTLRDTITDAVGAFGCQCQPGLVCSCVVHLAGTLHHLSPTEFAGNFHFPCSVKYVRWMTTKDTRQWMHSLRRDDQGSTILFKAVRTLILPRRQALQTC